VGRMKYTQYDCIHQYMSIKITQPEAISGK
jgi:hypothetical protein